MAIEGPLRELGIHDVFQLLDLSRKTGALRVSSELREDEGLVFFDGGRVVQATIRSTAMPTEVALLQAGRVTDDDIARARARQAKGRTSRDIVDMLVELGAITQKELERQLRLHIESVVFELMSWREGFFSFEERSRGEMPADTRITVSTESLLMEGARRIDEWSRIADIVPNLAVIPELAPVGEEREVSAGGATLDLLPHEWQVLTMIDGERDLRAIAASLGRDEFEIAKIAYGLATTGIIWLRTPTRTTAEYAVAGAEIRRAAARTHTRAGRHAEAVEELRRALQEDPLTPSVHLDHAFAAARTGDLAAARAGWEHFLRLSPDDPAAERVRGALDAVERLQRLVDEESDG
jgi:tetratricopeptide (TPR) repeat protein